MRRFYAPHLLFLCVYKRYMIKDYIVTDKQLLSERCCHITEENIIKEIQLINETKKWVLDKQNNALGLASVQVGSKLSWFVMLNPNSGNQTNPIVSNDQAIVIANPKIIEYKGQKVYRVEGCLSLPQESYSLYRFSDILVRYQLISEDGKLSKPKKSIFSGLAAQIFQHEESHIRGVLIENIGKKNI